MAKPDNPGQGNGNQGNEGTSEDAYAVVVVASDATHRFEGTSHLAVAPDGALIVGKAPVAVFASTEWLRAYVEEALESVP